MKPIDADKLKEQISVAINSMIEGDETEEELKLLGLIKATLDAAIDITPTTEIVSCKNCKHLLKDNASGLHLCMQNRFARRNVKLDDYCSYGEKEDST